MDRHVQTRRLNEADLFAATIALDAYSRTGPPPVLVPVLAEPCPATLRRVLDAVAPSDLSRTAAGLWRRLRAVHEQGHPLTWETVCSGASAPARQFAAYAQSYGMGVALYAPKAAERALLYKHAQVAFDAHQRGAAAALEAMGEAMVGICG